MTREKIIQFTREQGEVLVKLARRTLSHALGVELPANEADERLLKGAPFDSSLGTFVTLKKRKQLRGCIGNITAPGTVAEGVRSNALSAAFNDYRFSPVDQEELPDIEIEVSVLTEPVPLAYSEEKPLSLCLTPHVDGVIIRKGEAGATFLPQVWEQLPDPESFLSHLCIKAGLQANEWQRPGLTVFVYKVQYFKEKTPD